LHGKETYHGFDGFAVGSFHGDASTAFRGVVPCGA
jgi:hypothetical protein